MAVRVDLIPLLISPTINMALLMAAQMELEVFGKPIIMRSETEMVRPTSFTVLIHCSAEDRFLTIFMTCHGVVG